MLMARGDGPFKVLAKVGADAYKLELLGNMAALVTFNIGDLSPYLEDEIDCGDLRENPFKKGGMMQIKAHYKLHNLRMGRPCLLIISRIKSVRRNNSILRLF